MKCILFKKATKDKVALYEYIRWCHVISFREACKLFFCQLICLYLSVSTKLFFGGVTTPYKENNFKF